MNKKISIKKNSCPVCDSKETLTVFKASGIPIYNLQMHRTRASALGVKRGDIHSLFCTRCLFAFNGAFDSKLMDYQVDYESNRGHSQMFVDYLNDLCRRMNRILKLDRKTVVEVGCGDGQFLKLLSRECECKGFGFDPSFRAAGDEGDLRFSRSYFQPQKFAQSMDALIFRHVLEHQPSPSRFLKPLLPESGDFDMYVEVPCWEWIVENNSINAFSYEHCSYYTEQSLNEAMRQLGLHSRLILRTFRKEYLQYFGTNRTGRVRDSDPERKKELLIRGTERFKENIRRISQELKAMLIKHSPRGVLWGAAGKGTTLLNVLGIDHRSLELVVDSNVRRHGTFIPGTGQKVIAPEELKTVRPEIIFLTNTAYRPEIERRVRPMIGKVKFVSLDKIMENLNKPDWSNKSLS